MFAEINYIYHYKKIIKEELGKVKKKLEKDGNVICSKTKNKSLCADTPAVSVREPSETIWKIYGSGYAGGLL